VKCPTDRMEIRVAVPVYMSVEMPDAESAHSLAQNVYVLGGGQCLGEIRPWPCGIWISTNAATTLAYVSASLETNSSMIRALSIAACLLS